MNATTNTSNGGYWMLAGLLALLITPMVVGHFVITPPADVAQHADASPAQ